MIDMYKDYKIHFLISRNIEKELKTKNSTIKSVEVMECKHYILYRSQISEDMDQSCSKEISIVSFEKFDNINLLQ